MSSTVLELLPSPENARNSEGAFISLNDGSVLFAWTQYTGSSTHDHASARIVARVSRDAGRTWENGERVLVEPGDSLNVMSVSLLRLQDGRIMMAYLHKYSGENNAVHCIPTARFSSDEMATLSEPVPLTLALGYYVLNNDRIIQTQSGRIIAPVGLHRFRMGSSVIEGVAPEPFLSNAATVLFLFSDDGGQTWCEALTNCYCCFPNGRGLQEPGIIELKESRLWSWMRTGWQGESGDEGRQWQSFSEDGGQAWSAAEPSIFRSPCSPLSMKRIPSTGDLLAIWNDHSGQLPVPPAEPPSKGRTPLVAAISQDEGVTWQHHALLEDSPIHGFCYTAIHFVEDAVLLAYCSGGREFGGVLTRLTLRRVPLADFYAN